MDNFKKKMRSLRENLETAEERFKTTESELSSTNNTVVEVSLLHSVFPFFYQSI